MFADSCTYPLTAFTFRRWDSELEGKVRSTGAATFTQDADSGQKGTDKAESPVLVEFKKIVVKYT